MKKKLMISATMMSLVLGLNTIAFMLGKSDNSTHQNTMNVKAKQQAHYISFSEAEVPQVTSQYVRFSEAEVPRVLGKAPLKVAKQQRQKAHYINFSETEVPQVVIQRSVAKVNKKKVKTVLLAKANLPQNK